MLTRALLADDLRATTFAGEPSSFPGRIGAEVEFFPLEAGSRRRCPIDTPGVTSTLPFLRRFGATQDWREGTTAKGTPCIGLPGGGTITFEPGGQLEYSSPPCRSAAAAACKGRTTPRSSASKALAERQGGVLYSS